MNEIRYKKLAVEDIHDNMLKSLIRHQTISRIWYLKDGVYKIKEDYFEDSWDDARKADIAKSLGQCILAGGAVVAALEGDELIGFANIDSQLIGKNHEYVEMPFIHVSNNKRGQGIGKVLFELICSEARKTGAKKMYIGAHPSVETQGFYLAIGCNYAEEIIEYVYNKQPTDIQMEYLL